MKLVYVHGRAQEGKDAQRLRIDEWDGGLKRGMAAAQLGWPAGLSTELPFFGDTLSAKVGEVDHANANGLVARGDSDSGEPDYQDFTERWLEEMAQAQGIDLDSLVDPNGQPVARGVANWKWVNALIRKLNEVKPLAQWSIDQFTHDVYLYLRYRQIWQPVDAIVDQRIPRDEPCVVVAHSLGSVVAYNVLRERTDRRNIKAWITVGSPLGVKAVVDKLLARGTRKAPFGVGLWYNARDAQDVVALNEVPAAWFGGAPAVSNSSHVNNRSANQHGITEYLADAEVARRIHAAVTS